MGMTPSTTHAIEKVIKDSLRKKFLTYKPETKNMPFHFRLLGKDRMALYSFIQSLNTTFGQSIYEPVATYLGKTKYKVALSQFNPGNLIYQGAQDVIQEILNDLSMGSMDHMPNKIEEINKIRDVSQKGEMRHIKTVNVDLFLENNNGTKFYFDIKTVKPNISGFKDHKKTLLEWCALTFAKDPNVNIKTFVAIPYNPYEPKPYERWTLRGMLDLEEELVVANEFWDMIGGEGTYEELLDCFERAGIEIRSEIDEHFRKYNM